VYLGYPTESRFKLHEVMSSGVQAINRSLLQAVSDPFVTIEKVS